MMTELDRAFRLVQYTREDRLRAERTLDALRLKERQALDELQRLTQALKEPCHAV